MKDRFANADNKESEMEGANNQPKILQAKIERSKDRIDSEGKLRSKGFGFVEFQEHAHAMAVLRQLNNNPTYFGAAKRLTVEFALENALVLRKREERLKKVQEKLGTTPGERASKATEKRKARRERREARLRLESSGKGGNQKKASAAKEEKGREARPVKQATKPSAAVVKKPEAKKAEAKKEKKEVVAKQEMQRPQKKRKRDEQEEKFQKMVNSYKQKLFKSSDEGDSMSRWMD